MLEGRRPFGEQPAELVDGVARRPKLVLAPGQLRADGDPCSLGPVGLTSEPPSLLGEFAASVGERLLPFLQRGGGVVASPPPATGDANRCERLCLVVDIGEATSDRRQRSLCVGLGSSGGHHLGKVGSTHVAPSSTD